MNSAPPVRRLTAWLLGATAALFALLSAWLAELCFVTRAENALLRDQQALAALEFRAAQNQLEAERLIARHELADLRQELEECRASGK